MKKSKVLWILALSLALLGITRLAAAQWVVGGTPPTPTPTDSQEKGLNGAENSNGKNAKGVEESGEKGANGGEKKTVQMGTP